MTWGDMAASARLPAPAAASPDAAPSYLGVMLSGQLCLLPLGTVRRLSPHVQPTRLPGAPARVLGARAVGGRVLPVLDLRAALGLPHDAPPEVDVEVAPGSEAPFLLAVTKVDGILRLTPDRLSSLGPGLAAAAARLDGRTAWLLAPSAMTCTSGTPASRIPVPPQAGAAG